MFTQAYLLTGGNEVGRKKFVKATEGRCFAGPSHQDTTKTSFSGVCT
jgi:hypothetical protein